MHDWTDTEKHIASHHKATARSTFEVHTDNPGIKLAGFAECLQEMQIASRESAKLKVKDFQKETSMLEGFSAALVEDSGRALVGQADIMSL